MDTGTEIRIQKIDNQESKEFRIQKAENSKQDTEEEIKILKNTLIDIQVLLDKAIPKTTAHEELKAFSKKIEKQIENNNDILEEIKQSIDYIKGH